MSRENREELSPFSKKIFAALKKDGLTVNSQQVLIKK
jgi:hypothetical protein